MKSKTKVSLLQVLLYLDLESETYLKKIKYCYYFYTKLVAVPLIKGWAYKVLG